ncbi:Spx/MgsR family RNA polymerase-binding regulatory protein [Paracnuella aquatica]|uniref:Spx/MgsR family RNA polymerase-binding regulatory protein n=1 Tax=Paracnuella aquatica TaxID=2268757 RepID=UPI000DEF2317|nr:Spx/MgsR family RNA polymerase-binding regulatory protein [Paracnuella aquatica]RPD51934.1 Spx/MgsR family RNA polymerase-binding regulatory protein [Paracnuella aquatica]
MYTVYGLANCDTVRKAIKWLKEINQSFQFHDFRKDGIDAEKINDWVSQMGVAVLLNKKSATWRGLGEAEQAEAATERGAIQLMAQHPALIKRPVVEQEGKLVAVGFPAAGLGAV